MNKLRLIILCTLLASLGMQAGAQIKPALNWKDVSKWRYIKNGSATLSPDGQWTAYTTGQGRLTTGYWDNHGIAKLPNRKDYAVRMMEYFDYMLKDKPAPTWWSKGINRIDMDKYLEARAFDDEQ